MEDIFLDITIDCHGGIKSGKPLIGRIMYFGQISIAFLIRVDRSVHNDIKTHVIGK